MSNHINRLGLVQLVLSLLIWVGVGLSVWRAYKGYGAFFYGGVSIVILDRDCLLCV